MSIQTKHQPAIWRRRVALMETLRGAPDAPFGPMSIFKGVLRQIVLLNTDTMVAR